MYYNGFIFYNAGDNHLINIVNVAPTNLLQIFRTEHNEYRNLLPIINFQKYYIIL